MEVAVPVGVRKHVDNQIDVVIRHLPEILLGVERHPIAVIRDAKL
jgi:hypothetical protein